MLIHADEKSFEKVRKTSQLFLLDFFATWCGPCRMLSAELEKVSKTTNEFDIVKINSDENIALVGAFGVEVLPTLFVFKDGKPVQRLEGYLPAEEIIKIMKKFK